MIKEDVSESNSSDSSYHEIFEDSDDSEEFIKEDQIGQINCESYRNNTDVKMEIVYEIENEGFQKLGINELATPFEYFHLLFSYDLIDQILKYTYCNGEKKIMIKTKSSRRSLNGGISIDDILCFIGMIMTKGLLKKPTLKCYWETSLLTGTPELAKLIIREQFLQIY